MMIPTNDDQKNPQSRTRFFNWLDTIMGNSKPSKDAGGQDTPPQQLMSKSQPLTLTPQAAPALNTGSTLSSENQLGTFGVDWDFIRQLEGRKLKGYVPTDKGGNVFGQSGVTVGTGFDIGQRSPEELRRMGLSPTTVDKILPYAGKKKSAAVKALTQMPLRLTNEEVDEIDRVVKKQALDRLVGSYNKKSKTKFEDLLPEQQTILASVAFQYGDLAKATPNFWREVTKGNWEQAHRNLLNFGDKYQTRRHKEASLLSRIVNV